MGFSDSEAFEVMASALQDRGLATTEQIQTDRATQPFAAPAGEQQSTVADTTGLSADAVDPAAGQLDQNIYAPPSSPDDYRFLPPANGTTRDAAQERATAQAFHDIGLPASIASHADRLFSQAMQSPPTAEQLESSRQQGHVQLTHTFGADTPRVIATAQAEFNRMVAKAPHLKDLAEVSGLGNNPLLVSQLYFNAVAKGRGPK